MRLNGWLGIGAVASVLWLVGHSAYLWKHEVDVRSYHAEALKGSVRSCELHAQLQGCSFLSTAGEILSEPISPKLFLLPPLAWLVASWIALGLAYAGYRRIRQGFRAAG